MLVYFLETLEDESDKDYIIWLYNEFERLMYSTAFKYTTIPQIAEDIVKKSGYHSCNEKAGFGSLYYFNSS